MTDASSPKFILHCQEWDSDMRWLE